MFGAMMTEVPTTELVIADDLTLRAVGPGEVRIKIAHSGVCHSDLSMMNGTIPATAPRVLGHEASGVITDVGDGVTNLAQGDHIVVAFSPPCGSCAYCNERAQANLCFTGLVTMSVHEQFLRGDEVVGSMSGCGTFAEETIVPAIAAIKIDNDIPLDVAALVGCAITTGVGAALNGAKVTPGSSVVVIGCGGVGIAAIQGARIAGASAIVAVDLHEGKLDRAKTFGATDVATPDQIEEVKTELTGGEGFDFALECVGHPTTIRATYDAARRGGTAVIVGVGRMEQKVEFSAFELFFAEKTLKGSMFGSANVHVDMPKLLRLWKVGKLDLEGMITRRMKLEEVNEAFRAMQAGEVVRSVLDIN